MVEVRKYNVRGSNNEYLGFRKGEIEARTIQGEDAENIRVYRYCLERTPYTVYLASNKKLFDVSKLDLEGFAEVEEAREGEE